MIIKPTTKHEQIFWDQGLLVAGMDEVGRGAVAGPVVVGVVLFDPKLLTKPPSWITKIRDSKTLSAKARTTLSPLIKAHTLWWAIGCVPADTIDRLGMTKALELAAQEALRGIPETDCTLTDRNLLRKPQDLKCQEIIDGDSECVSIAAASIIAKVWRDELMQRLGANWRQKPYKWHENKGYATVQHLASVRAYGPSFYHRHSFLSKYI